MLVSEISNLPEEFRSILRQRGYESLYPPQEEAIKSGVLEGKNLVLATPTASGKTLVAMMAAMKAIESGGKVVYLAPLRALASEKYDEFKELFGAIKSPSHLKRNLRVAISTGDFDSSGENLGRSDIVVLTNERFDSVIRHGATWIESVSLFIADEVHLVGDDHRGPTLEMILAKIMEYVPSSQILALSATISNTADLAKWIDAKLVDMDWRPVKLVEGIYDYGELRFHNGESFPETTKKIPQSNRGAAIDVALDCIKEGGQALIFCETRKRAVSMAERAAETVPPLLSFEESAKLREIAQKISSSGEETDVSRRLAEAVESGAAFHHAGLDSRHRKIIEDAFRARQIKILTSTPTLAAGINMPARRVVLSSLMRYDAEQGGQAPISVLEFKQMAGRAGRPRYDKTGEIVLLSGNAFSSEDLMDLYIRAKPEPIRSKLSSEGALRSHVLGLIASANSGMTEQTLMEFFKRTLFAAQYRRMTVTSRIKKALVYLEEEGLVKRREKTRLIATEFGKRVAMLYINPESAIIMRRGIKFAKEGVDHTWGLLHLIVQTPDMSPKFGTRQKDSPELEEVFESAGGDSSEVLLMPLPKRSDFSFYQDLEETLGNFRTVLALNAWINERPEQHLLERYSIEPGDVHRMVDNADWLLYSCSELAKLFGRNDLSFEAEEVRARVRYGIKPELIQLTKLEGIGRVRGRALFNAGYTTVEKLQESPLEKLAMVPKIGSAVATQIKRQLE